MVDTHGNVIETSGSVKTIYGFGERSYPMKFDSVKEIFLFRYCTSVLFFYIEHTYHGKTNMSIIRHAEGKNVNDPRSSNSSTTSCKGQHKADEDTCSLITRALQ
jgi:hypothetical protein